MLDRYGITPEDIEAVEEARRAYEGVQESPPDADARRMDGGKTGGDPEIEVTPNDELRAQYLRQKHGTSTTAWDVARERHIASLSEPVEE